jgi:hypothetical protein
MRLLPAWVAAVSLLLGASAIAAELTMAPVRNAPRPLPAQLGRFSGSVSDPSAKQASDVLAKESKFNRATRAKPVRREFGAMLRGSIVDFGSPSSSETRSLQ